MDTLTRWDPFKDLDDLQNRLATLFGRAPVRKDVGKEEAMTVAEWAPLVDIAEDDKEYLIKAELPEVKREDVKVAVQDNSCYQPHGVLRSVLSSTPSHYL